jgi:hypothetical protein
VSLPHLWRGLRHPSQDLVAITAQVPMMTTCLTLARPSVVGGLPELLALYEL